MGQSWRSRMAERRADDGENYAAALAAMIPGARALVAGEGNHGMSCSDTEFQRTLVDS